MSKSKHLWWQEMTLPELQYFAKEVSDIAILPIGATEQHGPHSPNGVDLFNAKYMAQEIAKKTDVMLLPPLPYDLLQGEPRASPLLLELLWLLLLLLL